MVVFLVEVWREGGRRKEGRKEGRTALIKSNNPHLAGDGECFNAMVGITRSKVIYLGGFLIKAEYEEKGTRDIQNYCVTSFTCSTV